MDVRRTRRNDLVGGQPGRELACMPASACLPCSPGPLWVYLSEWFTHCHFPGLAIWGQILMKMPCVPSHLGVGLRGFFVLFFVFSTGYGAQGLASARWTPYLWASAPGQHLKSRRSHWRAWIALLLYFSIDCNLISCQSWMLHPRLLPHKCWVYLRLQSNTNFFLFCGLHMWTSGHAELSLDRGTYELGRGILWGPGRRQRGSACCQDYLRAAEEPCQAQPLMSRPPGSKKSASIPGNVRHPGRVELCTPSSL